ncbi:c-type cytochrome [Halothiobacillus sp.]|uniref:c-type cytochrome n=1 Tax=Halothiobacillus sp. TaxID=1891311 RepID=UPI00263643E2|nr:c-type cytochrome [Halothiobacillus sp.]
MKKITFAFVLSLGSASLAAAAERPAQDIVHWTPTTWAEAQRDMPKGNAAAGKKLHSTMFCASCHGAKGESATNNWPSLAGQSIAYTYKQLLDYKSQVRNEDDRAHIMVVVAQMLSKQDMTDLAAFYADQTQPCPKGLPKPAPSLVTVGDPKRLITPCAACHGARGQGGVNETTALRGITRDYFIRTMEMFREGHRTNDTSKGMSQFAKPLTDQEIALLADYYACTPPEKAVTE